MPETKKAKKQDLFKRIPARKNQRLTRGQLWADRLTKWAGSWAFISGFIVFLVAWILINLYFLASLGTRPFDPYPFILLNLFLSCLAAIQAPIILMSENRELERDRHRAELDYYVNRRAEKEIKVLQRELMEIKAIVSQSPKEKEIEKIESEICQIQKELENAGHKA